MNDLESRIFEVIRNPHLASFATNNEDGKPWVRYVMAIGDEDFTVRFSTFVTSRKFKQIQQNAEVHLTCGVTSLTDLHPYLQIQGKAIASSSQEEKDKFWNPELEKIFQGPNDPNYVVVIVKPYHIEYNLPKTPEPPEIWIKD